MKRGTCKADGIGLKTYVEAEFMDSTLRQVWFYQGALNTLGRWRYGIQG